MTHSLSHVLKFVQFWLQCAIELVGREGERKRGSWEGCAYACVSGGDRGVSLSKRIRAIREWRGMRASPAASPRHHYPTGERPVGGHTHPGNLLSCSPILSLHPSSYTPALNTSVCRIWFHSAPDQGPWQLTTGFWLKPPNGSHSVMIYTALLYTPAAASSC